MEFGDRLFWGILIFIGAILFWLGVLETLMPLWIGSIAGAVAGCVFILYGPRPNDKEVERMD